jgi:ribonucleoside-diphosphate reductase alpha chain
MEIIEKCTKDPKADDSWELVDRSSGKVKETVSAKWLWQKILELRMLTGEPYLLFIDTANEALPTWLKDKGLRIRQSNICSEILIPTDKDRTAVCCLSSVNLSYYDDWCGIPEFIKDVAELLDNVLIHFIASSPEVIKRAVFSASQGRDIGIGVLGFHTLLQKKNVPLESAMAKSLNLNIFKHIRSKVDEANYQLGAERGEAPDCVGTGRRFSMSMAIAPTASTSLIMGNISPSIEPMRANCYRQDTMSGAFFNKNRVLDELIKTKCLEDKKLDYNEIWDSIITNDGSVQHLKCLDQDTKDVFKTAMEINQLVLVHLAADRQKYIDQTQSLNLFFRPNANVQYLHAVHLSAWKLGVRTLYYCRSEKLSKTDKIAQKIEREVITQIQNKEEICFACQ